jgi:putative acetyltransferase
MSLDPQEYRPAGYPSATMALRIESAEDMELVRALFRQYEADIGIDLCFQDFAGELAGLPGDYGPPNGELLIAWNDSQAAGCVALRPFGYATCEMKRLFVRPEFRGKGYSRRLTEAVIDAARNRHGYLAMLLDTVPERMPEAVNLYRSLGFTKIAPYNDNPMQGALHMQLVLNPDLWRRLDH